MNVSQIEVNLSSMVGMMKRSHSHQGLPSASTQSGLQRSVEALLEIVPVSGIEPLPLEYLRHRPEAIPLELE